MTARWPVLSDRVGIQDRHDFNRKASSIDHSDEIPMLEMALAAIGDDPLPIFSVEGVANMRARLVWLKHGEKR